MGKSGWTIILSLFLSWPAGAQTADELMARARSAYLLEDWARCAELYPKAAAAAPYEQRAAAAFFGAAVCGMAAGGDREAAFASLDKAAAKGFRGADEAAAEPALEPLRDDPRWKTFFAGVQARHDAYRKTRNAELARLFQEDQGDRRGMTNATSADWEALGRRDAERRRRVDRILAEGGAKVADDYYHAAMVFQHGTAVEDYDRAHQLALKAVELDPAHDRARWLAAAAKDRSLVRQGKPQLYGTQMQRQDGRWGIFDIDPSVTDAERSKWLVPPLADAKRRAERMNDGKQ
jgi:hypothetical protein